MKDDQTQIWLRPTKTGWIARLIDAEGSVIESVQGFGQTPRLALAQLETEMAMGFIRAVNKERV